MLIRGRLMPIGCACAMSDCGPCQDSPSCMAPRPAAIKVSKPPVSRAECILRHSTGSPRFHVLTSWLLHPYGIAHAGTPVVRCLVLVPLESLLSRHHTTKLGHRLRSTEEDRACSSSRSSTSLPGPADLSSLSFNFMEAPDTKSPEKQFSQAVYLYLASPPYSPLLA